MLSAHEIQANIDSGHITISPFNGQQLGPNSYDVRLGPVIYRIIDQQLDLRLPYQCERINLYDNGYNLLPGECYLGVAAERIASDYFIQTYEGRSTIARYFISSHCTAGVGDVGFDGHLTLEITVSKPIIIYPNMRIGQVMFTKPSGLIDKLYRGSYCNDQCLPIKGRPNNYM